ncbi:ABC transporter permease, partial [Bacteroidota bacterium]
WVFKDHDFLCAAMDEVIRMKRVGGSIFYGIIMMLAMLAVFDTQILSIFRRQREIGTFIAMGMTRGQVVSMFTVEGTMHAVLAALVGAVYGIPLLYWSAVAGWAMPEGTDDYGLPIADKIYPAYSLGLVIITIIIVMLTTAIVSYLPSRKIAKMNPTLAIKGKIQ